MEHVCITRSGLAEMGREQGLGLTVWLHAQTQLKAAVGTVLLQAGGLRGFSPSWPFSSLNILVKEVL